MSIQIVIQGADQFAHTFEKIKKILTGISALNDRIAQQTTIQVAGYENRMRILSSKKARLFQNPFPSPQANPNTGMGSSLEQAASAMGILTNAGLRGTAGAGFQRMMMTLNDSLYKGQEFLNDLGISTEVADGKFVDILGVVGQLGEKLSALSEADKINVLSNIFDGPGITAAMVLMDGIANKDFSALVTGLEGSESAAKRMSDTMAGLVLPQGRQLAELFPSLTGGTTSWIKGNKKIAATLLGVASAGAALSSVSSAFDGIASSLSTVASTIDTVTSTISTVTAVFTASKAGILGLVPVLLKIKTIAISIGAVIGGLSLPVLAVVAAMAAAAGLIIYYWDDVKKNLFSAILPIIEQFKRIGAIWNEVFGGSNKEIDECRKGFDRLGWVLEGIGMLGKAAFESILMPIKIILLSIEGVLEVLNRLKDFWLENSFVDSLGKWFDKGIEWFTSTQGSVDVNVNIGNAPRGTGVVTQSSGNIGRTDVGIVIAP